MLIALCGKCEEVSRVPQSGALSGDHGSELKPHTLIYIHTHVHIYMCVCVLWQREDCMNKAEWQPGCKYESSVEVYYLTRLGARAGGGGAMPPRRRRRANKSCGAALESRSRHYAYVWQVC